MATNKKQIGIWLDFKEAWLIILDGQKDARPEIKHLKSEIEWGVPKGGSRSKAPWGPQSAINEQAFLARRKKAEKQYFEAIISAIDPQTDELMLFGPAEAKIGLQQAIINIKHFRPQVKSVHPADSMTQNQIVAAVKDFFNV